MHPKELSEVEPLALRVAQEIRNQYIIAYTPSSTQLASVRVEADRLSAPAIQHAGDSAAAAQASRRARAGGLAASHIELGGCLSHGDGRL